VAAAQDNNCEPGFAGNCRYRGHCLSMATIFNLENISGRIAGNEEKSTQGTGGKPQNLQG